MRPNFAQRVEAAWLWSHRQGVVAGLTAARLWGAKWIDDAQPVELIWPNARPPRGISTSAPLLAVVEMATLNGIPVTSLARTAFDLARRRPLQIAVERVDALGNSAPFTAMDVTAIAGMHPGVRGIRQVERVLDIHDPGAQSPKETWLRLVVMRAGFPRPRTQIPVARYYLDMGWEDPKVALEYDGDQHRTDKAQFARDVIRLEELADLGWTVVRVVAGTPTSEVVRRVRRAWESSTLR
jgi:very-short-patch-repair endonuclease